MCPKQHQMTMYCCTLMLSLCQKIVFNYDNYSRSNYFFQHLKGKSSICDIVCKCLINCLINGSFSLSGSLRSLRQLVIHCNDLRSVPECLRSLPLLDKLDVRNNPLGRPSTPPLIAHVTPGHYRLDCIIVLFLSNIYGLLRFCILHDFFALVNETPKNSNFDNDTVCVLQFWKNLRSQSCTSDLVNKGELSPPLFTIQRLIESLMKKD